MIDGNSHTTQWGYDFYGRATNKVDATSTTILKYQYDADNRLTNRWSLEKTNTVYVYDNVGNLISVTYPASSNLSFSYDAMNRMTNMTDGIGTSTFTYTPTGQLTSETGPWASDTISYGYSQKRRSSLNLGQPNATGWAQTYGFDSAARMHTISSPAGGFTYTYDSGLGGASTSSGLIDKLALPTGGFITNTFDGNGRMSGTYLYNPSLTDLDSMVYTNNVGNQRIAAVRNSENYANYTYDPTGQLTSDLAFESTGNTTRYSEQLHYGVSGQLKPAS